MNQKKWQKKDNMSKDKANIKQFQRVFKPSTSKNPNVSRSKSKDRSFDKSPARNDNSVKATKISQVSRPIVRKCHTPDKPIAKKRNERSPNIVITRESHYQNTKTPSPLPKKSIQTTYSNSKNTKAIANPNNTSNDQISPPYGANSCSDYSSKTKIVKALNELNTEINQIYNKNKQINRQVKPNKQQPGCSLSTKNSKNNSNTNNSIRLNTSDSRHSPLLFKNKKYITEEYDKLNSKETKESNNSSSNPHSNNKSIRDHSVNCCYSFEDSRCSNAKGIETIEEVHYVFVALIQKSKSMIKVQENISSHEDNSFDTVLRCEERDVFNHNSYN